MKLTKRKGFNFFRSYFDVYNELNDKDKVAFIDALLNRQFLGIKPTDLKGMAKFAYISQVNSIDSQVKGFEDKTGIFLTPTDTPNQPPPQGVNEPPTVTPCAQVEEKVEEKVEVKEENPLRAIELPFVSEEFQKTWIEWEQYRKEKKQKLTTVGAKKQIKFLSKFKEQEAIDILNQSMTNGWSGLFEIKTKPNGTSKTFSSDKLASIIESRGYSTGTTE